MPARLQSGLAVSVEKDNWVLLNASPDVSIQIERYLSSSSSAIRSSSISNVLLTNADLDHVIGLLLMRENDKPLQITAPASVRRTLYEDFPVGSVLNSFCGIEWTDIGPGERRSVAGLLIRCVALKCRKPPRYSKRPECDVVGYLITDPATERTAGFFPDVSCLDDDLLAVFSCCDALFLDGTFWSDREMLDLKISQSLATEMGHLPISGEGGSLMKVAALPKVFRAYIHINNTNPILLPDTPERQAIEKLGIVLAEDGMSLTL